MSFLESFLSLFGIGDPQWLCMVTLFLASVVTLIIYFVQYYRESVSCESTDRSGSGSSVSREANALLRWALSLKSWKTEWSKAWVNALNEQARLARNSLQLTFQEESVQSTELVLSQVSGLKRTSQGKMLHCHVSGEKLEFLLEAQAIGATSTPLQQYTVALAPLQLQLELQLREVDGVVHLNWGLLGLESRDLQLSPHPSQGGMPSMSVSAVRERLRQVLCRVRPTAILSSRGAQPGEIQDVRSKASTMAASPPKPPRAHDWKLLVKNIRVAYTTEDLAAGGVGCQCVLQLNDPPQRLCSSVYKESGPPSWDQPFIFELNGKSKELALQLVKVVDTEENTLLCEVSVPFDLVMKQPKGLQTFALTTKDVEVGTLTTELTYLEPSEVRTWQSPTPAASKRVEMDRTVMPCGTVVTTITAVKSKPGRALPPRLLETPLKPPTKAKLSERRVSEQPSMLGVTVSKALSSSDTELLMLNGTDPVAEAAIRQLQESSRHRLKSPVKKSTIIISGVAKAPLSQDEELVLMTGYAAAMDASLSQGHPEDESFTAQRSSSVSTQALATGSASEAGSSLAGRLVPGIGVEQAPLLGEASRGAGPGRRQGPGPENGRGGSAPLCLGVRLGEGAGVEDWDSQSQAGEDPDADKTSLSLCMSETGSKKGKGGFLHKSAKLFFRRRHQRKDPGLSQSHNDLVYLEQPEAVAAAAGEREERQRRTATLRRIINRKLLHKTSGSGRANGSAKELPPA